MANRRMNQRGQAVVLMAMSLMMMCGLLGLVVDIGWANWRKEACKTAAEAAAQAAVAAALDGGASNYNVAGATNCSSSPTGTSPLAIGCKYAAQNGFTNGVRNATVTYQAGTTAGSPAAGVATTYWASYTVSENISTTFSAVLGKSRTTVSARATAGIIGGDTGEAAGCIYILDPTAPNAFQSGNNVRVTSGCGIFVASNANPAMHATGSARISAPAVSVKGTYATDNAGQILSPNLSSGATFPGDPFQDLPAPPVAQNCLPGNFTNWQATPYTPSPGTYCAFQVANGNSAVLTSGTYVIKGGNFWIGSGSGLSVKDNGGVLIYLTNGATVRIDNGTNVTLQPLSTGTYQGVLFYQDRTVTNPSPSTFGGGANVMLSGSLYFPHSLLNINNDAKTSVMAIVAARVDFEGGSRTINPATSQSQTGIASGTPPTIALIE